MFWLTKYAKVTSVFNADHHKQFLNSAESNWYYNVMKE